MLISMSIQQRAAAAAAASKSTYERAFARQNSWIAWDISRNPTATYTDVTKNASTDPLATVEPLYTIKSHGLNRQHARTQRTQARARATPGQRIGKSKWHGSKARGNRRLEEMKRVKRKEGKREGAAEGATDGADCKTGSDTHAGVHSMRSNVWVSVKS